MKELFLIFGDPINHSKSPQMHNFAFKKLKYNGCYNRYHLKDGSLLKEKIKELKIKGANITLPHKEVAYKICDIKDEYANEFKSVNTIVIKEDIIYGYNTDAPGFLKSIEAFKNIKKILIIGAGGTAKSTSILLKKRGFIVSILNRNNKEFFLKNNIDFFQYKELNSFDFDLIVNMTSAGLKDNLLPAPKEILEKLFKNAKGAVDIIYGVDTPFLKLAKDNNIPTQDGSNMLIWQGAYAFQLFTNNQFSLDKIKEALEEGFYL